MICNKLTVLGFVALSLAVTACAAESSPSDEDAPDGLTDTVSEQDQGTTYNGWSQSPLMLQQMAMGFTELRHDLYRTSGDTTRGGGACYVVKKTATCTADSDCQSAATAQYGSLAYGYCYSGTCYSRPGSQADNCVLHPNRNAGQLSVAWLSIRYTGQDYALGCMTKAAGFNTACGCTATGTYTIGSTNYACGANYSSLYMRTVTAASQSWASP